MTAGRITTRDCDGVDCFANVRSAAQRMLQRNVGSLVVVDSEQRPIGIVTDRDLALRVVGLGRDADSTPVAEIMTADPESVTERTAIADVIARMSKAGCRRMPVVDDDGALVGMITVDDVWRDVADRLAAIRGILDRSGPAALR